MTPEETAAAAAALEVDKKKELVVPEPEPPTPDPAEEVARTKGWKPKEEFTGDPGMWVDAKEFLGREPLFEKIRSQSRDLREVKKTVDAMARHFTKSVEHAVNAKVAELQYQKREAIKSGDVEEVEAIDKAIARENTAKAEVVSVAKVDTDPVVEKWVDQNPWYVKDAEMHDFALAFNDTYLKRHPGDLEGSLRKTTEAARKAFPDKFKSPPRPPAGGNGEDVTPAPVVEGSTAPAPSSKRYTLNRLTPDQRRVYDQIVSEHKVTTHDAFFKSLEEIGELTR